MSERYGLNAGEQAELAEYTGNRFGDCTEIGESDNGFLKTWESIIFRSLMNGAADTINEKVCPSRPVEFRSPEGVGIKMYDSFAGRIPIIYVRDASDFEQLVTNAAYKGVRPDNIEKTGASFIHGKTARFIILSAKPYSNVPESELGLDDEADWAEKSMILRREHECTHYFTKQTYGITNNILHDEIMADFTGMYEAFGFYKAEWFLRFMGLIEGSGGRLIYYTCGLSENVCRAVSEIVREAAFRLEEWSVTDRFMSLSVPERIKAMCRAGLVGISRGEL